MNLLRARFLAPQERRAVPLEAALPRTGRRRHEQGGGRQQHGVLVGNREAPAVRSATAEVLVEYGAVHFVGARCAVFVVQAPALEALYGASGNFLRRADRQA